MAIPSNDSEQVGSLSFRGRLSKAHVQNYSSRRSSEEAKGQQSHENGEKKTEKRGAVRFLETDPQEPRTDEEAADPTVRDADLANS